MKVLVASSREWWCAEAVRSAFDLIPTAHEVLVAGVDEGADPLVEAEARARGIVVTTVPVSPAEVMLGPSGLSRRHTRMVEGASLCLAFVLPNAPTAHVPLDLMHRARLAGVPVRLIRPVTPKKREATP